MEKKVATVRKGGVSGTDREPADAINDTNREGCNCRCNAFIPYDEVLKMAMEFDAKKYVDNAIRF